MEKAELSFSRSSYLTAWPAIAGCTVLSALAAFFGYPSVAAVLMFIALFALTARVWAQLAMRRVTVSVRTPAGGIFPDDTLEMELTAENGKFLPLIWLEICAPVAASRCLLPEDSRRADDWEAAFLEEMHADTELVGEKRFPFLRWYEHSRLTMRWQAKRRGLYSMKGWRIRTGDGFGLVQLQRPLRREDIRTIAVYPRLVKVSPDLFLRNLWNSENGARGVMEDPTVIRSTRDYLVTDSLKHINWRLTARGLPLAVNVYEDILPKSAHFLFDGNSFSRPDGDPEEMEDALSILASLCVRLDSLSVSCGLSLPVSDRGKAVNLFAAAGAGTEQLLRAMAGYTVPKPEIDTDSGEPVYPPARFGEDGIYDGARHAGRFYYIAYNTAGLPDSRLLRALGESAVTILTYEDCERFGGYETVCLRQLKEVRREA